MSGDPRPSEPKSAAAIRLQRGSRVLEFFLVLLGASWAVTLTLTVNWMPGEDDQHRLDGSSSKYDRIAHSHHNPVAVAIHHKENAGMHHALPAGHQTQKLAANHQNAVHPVAGLDCREHDGPLDPEDAREMVYWKDIPKDTVKMFPFDNGGGDEEGRKYLTFEPDAGGWNNIRMSMETVVTMAIATGRVLVLPPSQRMYLLGKTTFNFADFFPLQELAMEHDGLEIITTEEFLEETMGKTVDRTTGEVSYPPKGRKTNWDGDTSGIKSDLGPWLRSISLMPDCDPGRCIFGIPQSNDPKDAAALARTFEEVLKEDGGKYISKDAHELFLNKPTPVDAPTRDRLREFLAGRRKLLVYDAEHQEAPVLHFHGKSPRRKTPKGKREPVAEPGGRLLVHFYAFLFFQDWESDLWTKRFVRDHLRYVDHVQCAAARVVHALRAKSADGFDSFHIRRGDFQYKKTRVSAETIVERARDVIPEGRVVYIGTDEKDKNFFKPLKEDAGWKVFFLDDFLEDVVGPNIDPHYYGMIDQLVVSRGDRFFGCWFSTFTGYILRLRGYHSPKEISKFGVDAEAFLEGKLPHTYFYALEESKTRAHDYWPIKQAFYAREFPTSWRQIDTGV